MKKVSIFINGTNRAIRIPKEFDFEGVSEMSITKEGDTLILRPVRPSWGSLIDREKADPDFLSNREDVIEDLDK